MSVNALHINSSVIKALLMVCTMPLLLTACSEDLSDSEEDRDRDILELIPFTQPFTEGGQMQTRAITLPDHYSVYSVLYPQASSEYASIHAYLITNPEDENREGNFVYNKDEVQMTTDGLITKTGWFSNIRVKQGLEYYVYGFMPASFSPSASISPNNGSYENKAVVSLNGIDAVTPADVCLVTGVKGFNTPITSSETNGNVELGCFSYTGQPEGQNFIYLLLDHLFACINLEFSVDARYSELRKIKLRKVTIAVSGTPKKRNLTVTIDGSNYTVEDVESDANSNPATVYDKTDPEDYIPIEGNTPLSVPGYFTPSLTTSFIVTSTYDVYDLEDNLVRNGCKAENSLKLNVTEAIRGNCYPVKFVIKPTYLYQLSEPDLDNPTIQVTP